MTDEESVAIVFEVKDMALALREARDQRDKLREAMSLIVDAESTDELYLMMRKARTTLAEMEDGV